MSQMTLQQCGKLHQQFLSFDYKNRLVLFDKSFTLNPFHFPAFDPSVAWYQQSEKLEQLTAIFNQEKMLGATPFQRKFVFGSKIFYFNVQPIQVTERNAFHAYMLRQFLEQKDAVRFGFEQRLQRSVTKINLIEEEFGVITHALQWIHTALKSQLRSLPPLLLRIFNTGLTANGPDLDSKVKVRRKFIELYLYAQGLLVKDYYHWLEQLLRYTHHQTDPSELSLSQKIALLHHCGVIDFLRGRDKKSGEQNLAFIISLITSAGEFNYRQVSTYLKLAGTGKQNDPLTKKNILFIQEQLGRLAIATK